MRQTVGAVLVLMVSTVPDSVNLYISPVLCESHYYEVCLCHVTCELSPFLREHLVRNTSNIPFRVPVGQSGSLFTVTIPDRCLSVSVTFRRVRRGIYFFLSVTFWILFCTVQCLRRLLYVPIRVDLRASLWSLAALVRRRTNCPTVHFSASLFITVGCKLTYGARCGVLLSSSLGLYGS